MTVVDLGSGAGYFSLKIAPLVAPNGRVFAVDLRRQSLAFLWIRAVLGGQWNLHVIRGRVDDPELPPAPVDAVLIANTYHELTAPEPDSESALHVHASWRQAGRRGQGAAQWWELRATAEGHHEIARAVAERQINQQGFQTVFREDTFINRSGDEDLWWLVVFRKDVNYFLSGYCESSARFSSSTLTRASPKKPSWRPWVLASTRRLTSASEMPRSRATRGTWKSAAAGVMCGSNPEADAVTRSMGTGALGFSLRAASTLALTPSISFLFVGPRLLPAELAAS